MSEILLDIKHLTCDFRLGKHGSTRAVDDVSFAIQKGEIFGLVGESGSGKSTVARCIMNICKPVRGNIFYKGIDVCDDKQFRINKKLLQAERQMIFQDVTSSLNQRMKVADIVAEPMGIHHRKPLRGTLRKEAEFQLDYVGLDKTCLDKYPSELSGGMCQRVAIARALTMEPKLLVADEPISSLDVSHQAQIINLFRHYNKEHGCSILFIAHDLAVVRYLCDRVGVMYQGKLVELAKTEELFLNPMYPYSKSLISAIPIPDPRQEKKRVLQVFDATCFERNGKMVEVSKEHFVWEGGAQK